MIANILILIDLGYRGDAQSKAVKILSLISGIADKAAKVISPPFEWATTANFVRLVFSRTKYRFLRQRCSSSTLD